MNTDTDIIITRDPENLVILTAGAHAAAHHSLNGLVDGLLRAGAIRFDADTGRYHHA